MDVRYSEAAEAYRAKIRQFLKENLPDGWTGIGALDQKGRDEFAEHWKKVLHENDLLAVNWPKKYGGADLTFLERVILTEELSRAGAELDDVKLVIALTVLGPTIMELGTEEQKEFFIPRILSGEHKWCQGLSEPNTGSDLAGLSLMALQDGDEWILNGQKIWTSEAHSANWICALARTDPDAPKHQGITMFMVPMDQPGIEVRPVINVCGTQEFNEVFFTDARAHSKYIIGEVNKGWVAASYMLNQERGYDTTSKAILHGEQLNSLIQATKDLGRNDDPHIRQRLASAYTNVELMRWVGLRMLTGVVNDQPVGPEGSIMKLMWSEHHQEVTELAMDIIGFDAMSPTGLRPANFFIELPGAPYSTMSWTWTFLAARSDTIRGGTSEIQRNIISEKVLGLPKEARADTGPWSKTLR